MTSFLLIHNTATIIGLWGSHSLVAVPHLITPPLISHYIPALCRMYTVPSPADHPTLCFFFTASRLKYRTPIQMPHRRATIGITASCLLK